MINLAKDNNLIVGKTKDLEYSKSKWLCDKTIKRV